MIGDVTPDQVRLKQFSSSSTQTETDELSVKAQYSLLQIYVKIMYH